MRSDIRPSGGIWLILAGAAAVLLMLSGFRMYQAVGQWSSTVSSIDRTAKMTVAAYAGVLFFAVLAIFFVVAGHITARSRRIRKEKAVGRKIRHVPLILDLGLWIPAAMIACTALSHDAVRASFTIMQIVSSSFSWQTMSDIYGIIEGADDITTKLTVCGAAGVLAVMFGLVSLIAGIARRIRGADK